MAALSPRLRDVLGVGSLQDIDESTLQRLIDNAVREDGDLDFKEAP